MRITDFSSGIDADCTFTIDLGEAGKLEVSRSSVLFLSTDSDGNEWTTALARTRCEVEALLSSLCRCACAMQALETGLREADQAFKAALSLDATA